MSEAVQIMLSDGKPLTRTEFAARLRTCAAVCPDLTVDLTAEDARLLARWLTEAEALKLAEREAALQRERDQLAAEWRALRVRMAEVDLQHGGRGRGRTDTGSAPPSLPREAVPQDGMTFLDRAALGGAALAVGVLVAALALWLLG